MGTTEAQFMETRERLEGELYEHEVRARQLREILGHYEQEHFTLTCIGIVEEEEGLEVAFESDGGCVIQFLIADQDAEVWRDSAGKTFQVVPGRWGS